MAVTLASFLLLYLVAGYFLFSHGLRFISDIFLVGPILAARIIYLLFFFFFLMLLFSNAVINYSLLFRSRECEWLLTLPIPFSTLFFIKTAEGMIISSWGLLFISAPIFAAYGSVYGHSGEFYLQSLTIYFWFLALPAAIASWILLLLVRFVSRWVLVAVSLGFLVWLGVTLHDLYLDQKKVIEETANVNLALNQALKFTNQSESPLIPSAWMADAMIQLGKGATGSAWFSGLLIISYGAMGLLLTWMVGARSYYPIYQHSIRTRAARGFRSASHNPAPVRSSLRFLASKLRIPGVGRAMRSLIVKDFLVFIRDPAQWAQFAIIFGLLVAYALNLGSMKRGDYPEFWEDLIGHLNLAVCSLALSTLTTRFVFPQFSLEGQRLAILSLAPFGLDLVVWQKLVFHGIATGFVSMALMLLSGAMIGQAWDQRLFFTVMIAVMSATLTALAVGLGVLFPNLREANPARIVSSFGGTLCLILSFFYILVVVFTLAVPAFLPNGIPFKFLGSNWFWAGVAILFSAIVSAIPLIFAMNRAKRVENFVKV